MSPETTLDPEKTRESILDAAAALFVEKGFAAVSMSAIADGAGVTKSLIHHHFGSKQDLWNQVKMRTFAGYAEKQAMLLAGSDGAGMKLVEESMSLYFRYMRANPGLVDTLKVEVYGSLSPMKQLASVGAPEPQQIVIRPYDPGTIKDIERAIVNSGLGFAPQNDGRVIRINVPPLTTETRKKLVARIKELTEEAKVSIRNVRRDDNKSADQEQKDKVLTEDERDQVKNDVQDLTKKYEGSATDLAAAKEKEVMED